MSQHRRPLLSLLALLALLLLAVGVSACGYESSSKEVDEDQFEAMESESIFALPFNGEVEAEEQIPRLDTPAQLGPIEGSIAIFLLPESASENRPLTLHIPGEGDEEGAEVTLDLYAGDRGVPEEPPQFVTEGLP